MAEGGSAITWSRPVVSAEGRKGAHVNGAPGLEHEQKNAGYARFDDEVGQVLALTEPMVFMGGEYEE